MEAVNYRINSDTRVPPNTFENHDWNAPEILYVPIVSVLPSNQVKIKGFAVFFLDKVIKNGNSSDVYGWFIRTVAPNGHNNASLADLLSTENDMENGGASTDYGMYTAKLVQ